MVTHLMKPSSSTSSSSFFSHHQPTPTPPPGEKISEPSLNPRPDLWVRSLLEELEKRVPDELLRRAIGTGTSEESSLESRCNNEQLTVSNRRGENVNSLVLIESSIVRELNQLYISLGTIIRKLNDEMIGNSNTSSDLLKKKDISITITSSASFESDDEIPTRDIDITAGVNNKEYIRQTFRSSLCGLEQGSDEESRLDIDFSGSYLIENDGKKLRICQQPSGSFDERYKGKYLHQIGRQLKESYTKSAVDQALDLIKQHQSNIESGQDCSVQDNKNSESQEDNGIDGDVPFEHIYRFISEKLLNLLAAQGGDDPTREFSQSDSSKENKEEEEVLQPDFSYSTISTNTNTDANTTTNTTTYTNTTEEDFVINEQLTMVAVGLRKRGFKIPRRNVKNRWKTKTRQSKTQKRPDPFTFTGNEQGEPCRSLNQSNSSLLPAPNHQHQHQHHQEGDWSWYSTNNYPSKDQICYAVTEEPPPPTSTGTPYRVQVCESMDATKLRDVWSRLHKTGLNHPDKNLNEELQGRLGVEGLLRASSPAKCCRPAVLNERQLRNAPYSPSLRSLPLKLEDLDIIEGSLGRSLERCSNSTDLHKDVMTYYINLDKENIMSYYINLVNYQEPLVAPPVSPPVYQIMHFTVSPLPEPPKRDAVTDTPSSFCLGVKNSFCLLKRALSSTKSFLLPSSSERPEPRRSRSSCTKPMTTAAPKCLLDSLKCHKDSTLERSGKEKHEPHQYKTDPIRLRKNDLLKVTSHVKLDVSRSKPGKTPEASGSNKNVISVFQVSAKESSQDGSEIDPSKLVAVPPDCKLVIVVKCTESYENVCEYMVRSRSGEIETVGTAALPSDSSSGDALKPQNIQVRVNGVPVKMDLDEIEEADMGNILICLKSTAENDRIEILMQADDGKTKSGKSKKGGIARRIKQCQSREVTARELNNQRPKKPSHPREEVSLYLQSAGVPKLVKASRPASCARNNLINGRPLKKAPYSASLNSLPLNITDLAIIEQSYAMAVGAEGEGKGGEKAQIRDSDDIKSHHFILTDGCKCKPPPETPTQEVRWFVVNGTKEEAAAPDQPQQEAFPYQRYHLLASEETRPEMVNASTQLELNSIDEFLRDLFNEEEEEEEDTNSAASASFSGTSEEDQIEDRRWSVTNVAVSEEDPQKIQEEAVLGSRTSGNDLTGGGTPPPSLAESNNSPGDQLEEADPEDPDEDPRKSNKESNDGDDTKSPAQLDEEESGEEDSTKKGKPGNDEPRKKEPKKVKEKRPSTKGDPAGDKNNKKTKKSGDTKNAAPLDDEETVEEDSPMKDKPVKEESGKKEPKKVEENRPSTKDDPSGDKNSQKSDDTKKSAPLDNEKSDEEDSPKKDKPVKEESGKKEPKKVEENRPSTKDDPSGDKNNKNSQKSDDTKNSAPLDGEESDEEDSLKKDKPGNEPKSNDKAGDKNKSPKDQSASSNAPSAEEEDKPQNDPAQEPKDKKSPCCDKATCCNVPEDRGVQSTAGDTKSVQCGSRECSDCQHKKKEKKNPCTDETCEKKPASKREEGSNKCGGKCCRCCDDDADGSCATCPKCKKIKEVLESVKDLKCTCKHQGSNVNSGRSDERSNFCGKCGKPKNNQKERPRRRSSQKYVTVSGCSEELPGGEPCSADRQQLLGTIPDYNGGGDAKSVFDTFNDMGKSCSKKSDDLSTISSPAPLLRLRGGASGPQQDITYATVRNVLENNLNASGHRINNPSQSKAAIDYVAYLVYKQIADGTVNNNSGQPTPTPTPSLMSRRGRTPSPRRFTIKQDSLSEQDETLKQSNRDEIEPEEELEDETGVFNKRHRRDAANDRAGESKGYVCNICNACVVNLAPSLPPPDSSDTIDNSSEIKSPHVPATTTSTTQSGSCGEKKQGAIPRRSESMKDAVTPRSASSQRHQHQNQHPQYRPMHCHQMEAFTQHLHSQHCKLPVWSRKPEQRTSQTQKSAHTPECEEEVTRDTSSRSRNPSNKTDPIEFTATVRRDGQAGCNDDLGMSFYAVRSIQVQTDAEEANPSRNNSVQVRVVPQVVTKEVQVSSPTASAKVSQKLEDFDFYKQSDLTSLLYDDYFKVIGEKRSSYDFSKHRSSREDNSKHASRDASSTSRKNHVMGGSYGLLDNLSDLLEKSNAIVDCYVLKAEGRSGDALNRSYHSTPPKSHHSLSLENFEQEINSILYNVDQPDQIRSKLQEERFVASSSSSDRVLSEATFTRLSKVYKEALWLSYQCNKLLLGHETELARAESRHGVLKAGDVFALGGVDGKERSVSAQTLWALTKVSVHPDGCKEMEVIEVTGNDPQKYKMFCFTD